MTRGRPVRIHSRWARGLTAAPWVFYLLAALTGILDPPSGADQRELMAVTIFLVATVALLTRSLRLGLTIDDNQVISRGILRTRHFPRDSITQIETTRYRGLAPLGNTSNEWFRMLRARAGERWVNFPQTWGPPGPSRRLEEAARVALGIPDREPSQ